MENNNIKENLKNDLFKIPEEFSEIIKSLKEILGSFIFGLNIIEIFTKWFNNNQFNDLNNTINEINNEKTLRDRLELIKNKIDNNNKIEVYGAILYLFSELERFVDIMFKKYCSNKLALDENINFRDKVRELENCNIISFKESNLLRYEIYPKRNLISHGKYDEVTKEDINLCFNIINNFILKYYDIYNE